MADLTGPALDDAIVEWLARRGDAARCVEVASGAGVPYVRTYQALYRLLIAGRVRRVFPPRPRRRCAWWEVAQSVPADLWPRLLAAGVRYRPGMLLCPPGTARLRILDEWEWEREADGPIGAAAWVPDLDDPATCGCLLAEVRRLSGCLHVHASGAQSVSADPVGWRVWRLDFGRSGAESAAIGAGSTEGGALIAALAWLVGVAL